ncbi:hypothetical protein CR513_24741, partial [Mucuna pruriens]
MLGIDPNVICHRLVLCVDAKPVVQRKRKTRGNKQKAKEQEMAKLKVDKFIQKVSYTTWLSNVVLVKKHNKKWRMLKNAGPTYQRLMDKVFTNHMGRNLEVYVDYMVVKSTSLEEHIKDLEEI